MTKPKNWKPLPKKKKAAAAPRSIWDQGADRAVTELERLTKKRNELLAKLAEVDQKIPRMELIVRTFRPEAASIPAMIGMAAKDALTSEVGTWPLGGALGAMSPTPDEIAQKEAEWQKQHPPKPVPQDQEEFLRQFMPPTSRITGRAPLNSPPPLERGESSDPDEFLSES